MQRADIFFEFDDKKRAQLTVRGSEIQLVGANLFQAAGLFGLVLRTFAPLSALDGGECHLQMDPIHLHRAVTTFSLEVKSHPGRGHSGRMGRFVVVGDNVTEDPRIDDETMRRPVVRAIRDLLRLFQREIKKQHRRCDLRYSTRATVASGK